MIELIFAMGMRSAALDRMSASRCASLSRGSSSPAGMADDLVFPHFGGIAIGLTG
jgi:hypothetical protein